MKGHTYEANIGEPQEGECSQVIPQATGQSKTGSSSYRTTHKDCPLKASSVEHSGVESDMPIYHLKIPCWVHLRTKGFFQVKNLKQICVT